MVYFISRSGHCLAACQDLFFVFAIVGLNSALNSLLQIVPSKYYVVLSSVQSSFLTDIYQLQRWRLMGPSVDVWIFLYLYFYLFLFLFFSLQLSPLQYFALWYVATLVSLFIMAVPFMVPPFLMWVPTHGCKPLFSLPGRNRGVVGSRKPSGLIGSSSESIGWWIIGLISSSWG